MVRHNIHAKAVLSLMAIVLFIICYLSFLALTVLLVALAGYVFLKLILLQPNIITVGIGLGLFGMACMVLYFLVKFMFKKHRVDRSGMLEIEEQDAPELFRLIRSIAEEVGTSYPKKVFVSSDVNASVFYDSSFSSMFFPVRKNLQIGLGLVNSVSEKELKAILAHEFGHFSQKSMKIGNYVHQVNQIIFNLLYENDSYHNLLNRFANLNRYFYFFARGSLRIVQGIQWVLAKTYYVVNLSYMGLSREMEFHADGVAASVAGSQPLIDSLVRLDFAHAAQNQVLQFYSGQVPFYKRAENIYPPHSYAMQLLARRFRLPLREDGLAALDEGHVRTFNRSQLEIRDQWASHPNTKDRAQRLRELNISVEGSDRSAWLCFAAPEDLQRRVTNLLYATVSFEQSPEPLAEDEFRELFTQQMEADDFDARYRGLYDHVHMPVFNPEEVIPLGAELKGIEDVFTDRVRELPYIQQGLAEDIALLEQIFLRHMKQKTFDYAGERYKWWEAEGLIRQLKQEEEQIVAEIVSVSRRAFALFYKLAADEGRQERLLALYEAYFEASRRYEADWSAYLDLAKASAFTQENTPFEKIRAMMPELKKMELVFKERLSPYANDPAAWKELDGASADKLKRYLEAGDLVYFTTDRYHDAHTELLFSAMRSFEIMASRLFLYRKKEVLDYQVRLLDQVPAEAADNRGG